MATSGNGVHVRRTAAIALALIATFALTAPALAGTGGNAWASAACEDGGYVEWTDAAGNPFRNAGACVSYAAHGGTLVPVVVEPVNPFAVRYAQAGPNRFQATLTATGLEPGSTVDLAVTWDTVTQFLGSEADAGGAITFVVSVICTSGGSAVTSVAAIGLPEGETVPMEFPLPLPDASACP